MCYPKPGRHAQSSLRMTSKNTRGSKARAEPSRRRSPPPDVESGDRLHQAVSRGSAAGFDATGFRVILDAMADPVKLPEGKEPVLRVLPMPADANHHGDIFGGWIMSQVDIAGGVLAGRHARGRVATVAVNSFH